MGILSTLRGGRRTLENPSTSLADPAAWATTALGIQGTYSSVDVSEGSAMRLGAVAACHRIIAESVASLPLVFYERLSQGKRRATEHPLYEVLHDQANPEMTAFTWREVAQHHLCGYGNAYSEIEYTGAGTVKALWPLLPDRTRPERKDGVKTYVTRVQEGTNQREVRLPASRVMHVPGLGFDGLKGYSYIATHKQMLGAAMAAEEFAARFFGSGMHLGVVLEHPGVVTAPAKERLRTEIEYLQGGLSNAHRVAIFEEGLKVNKIGVAPDDAQFLETRKFDVEQVARMYRVPLHMLQVGSEAGQSYASVEQKSLEFVQYTLRSWLVRWEQAIRAKLLSPAERDRYFAEHIVDGLLRGDYQSRMNGHAIRRQWGLASYNEIAEIENWNPDPTPYGDMRLVPLNMVPADMAREAAAKETAAEEPPAAARAEDIRDRTARPFAALHQQALQRLVRSELAEIRTAIKVTGDLADFVSRMTDFYGSRYARDAERVMAPVAAALAEALAEALSCRLADGTVQALLAEDIQRHGQESMEALSAAIVRSGGSMIDPAALKWDEWRDSQREERFLALAGRLTETLLASGREVAA